MNEIFKGEILDKAKEFEEKENLEQSSNDNNTLKFKKNQIPKPVKKNKSGVKIKQKSLHKKNIVKK